MTATRLLELPEEDRPKTFPPKKWYEVTVTARVRARSLEMAMDTFKAETGFRGLVANNSQLIDGYSSQVREIKERVR
jgi:hypothetical protein